MRFLPVDVDTRVGGTVLDRYYRLAGSPVKGRGPGLDIVESIAWLHGAQVDFMATG